MNQVTRFLSSLLQPPHIRHVKSRETVMNEDHLRTFQWRFFTGPSSVKFTQINRIQIIQLLCPHSEIEKECIENRESINSNSMNDAGKTCEGAVCGTFSILNILNCLMGGNEYLGTKF